MKRLFSILILCFILPFAGGCANKAETPDKVGIIETAPWPTEEWSISTPEEQGVDNKILSDAGKRINENYPNVYSLLVVRHGYLIYEKYYQGMNKDSANPIYSVTKSVMSALTGIALKEKLIQNVDQNMAGFFSEYFAEVDNNQKKEITIKNILTMSGGLEAIDDNYSAYFSSGDWLDYAIKRPLTDEPGTKFVYNTGLTHFLSGIITKTSKMKTIDFADQFLFSQIGMSIKKWDVDQKGYYGGGSGLYMKPVDMARFGYLYLRDGMWDGKQIIPKEWIVESTKRQIIVDPEMDYGYLFWVQTIKDKVHNKDYFAYSAIGSGGQKIVVIPELDMVVVVTANVQSAAIDKANTQDIISDYVIPAVK